jgi:hypothetical protein
MKVRAYLAEDQDRLVPKKDSGRHIDIDSSSEDPDQIEEICSLLFTRRIKYLDRFDRPSDLDQYLKEHDIIYRKYVWDGPGIYLLWMPDRHRMIYRSDILLERELQFMIALEEHLEQNSEGDIDRTIEVL